MAHAIEVRIRAVELRSCPQDLSKIIEYIGKTTAFKLMESQFIKRWQNQLCLKYFEDSFLGYKRY